MVVSLRCLACSGFSNTARAWVPIHFARVRYPTVSSSFRRFSSSALVDETVHFSPYPNAKETILVVGDGDLSYSASIATQTAASGGSLIASVLETQKEHETVYRNSQHHVQTIASHEPHQVLFGTDATKLHKSFPSNSFDRIQFNFPHWRGKSNNRYNRQLLSEFLSSASQVLKKSGEIQVALRTEQGGAHAKDLIAWRGSWKASELAADVGLLLSRLEPFEVRKRFINCVLGDRLQCLLTLNHHPLHFSPIMMSVRTEEKTNIFMSETIRNATFLHFLLIHIQLNKNYNSAIATNFV